MSWMSQWLKGKAKPNTQPPPTANDAKSVFNSGLDGIFDRTVQIFRQSEVGKAAENTATRQAIGDFFRNPLVLVGLTALAIILVTRR